MVEEGLNRFLVFAFAKFKDIRKLHSSRSTGKRSITITR
jgi:hypothetical protein